MDARRYEGSFHGADGSLWWAAQNCCGLAARQDQALVGSRSAVTSCDLTASPGGAAAIRKAAGFPQKTAGKYPDLETRSVAGLWLLSLGIAASVCDGHLIVVFRKTRRESGPARP